MKSIGAKFALVVLLTVATVGTAGFFAGRSILSQLASLADDKPVIDALTAGQKALVDLHRERRHTGEAVALACGLKPGAPCTLPDGGTVTVDLIPSPLGAEAGLPRWESETQYLTNVAGVTRRYTFPWPELKPRFAAVTDAIGTREHVNAILPELTSSFLVIYAAALLAAAALGLVVTFLLSRNLTKRVAMLVAYTRRIAVGALEPAPAPTRGPDEIGLLADSLHAMAKDLDETRQRLILSEKMQSWQNVARKVAHEIKNPLTPISLVADELRRQAGAHADGPTRALLEETGRILAEETASLGRMVQEFSAFARLPAPDLVAGDLLEVIRDFTARNARDDGPRLVIDAPREAFPCVLDRAMMIQIFHNLVNNARLAKLPARVTVTFTLSNPNGIYVLDVRDDGPGVPESLQKTLFDAYVTSRSTGDGEKGMGLGLTIARKIASDHGGRLNLHSTGPTGTVFRLELPLGNGVRHPR